MMTKLQQYNPVLHTKLQSMKNFVMSENPNTQDITDIGSKFAEFYETFDQFLEVDRSGIKVNDLILNLYSYKVMVDLYDVDDSYLETAKAIEVVGLGELEDNILAYPVDHYSDLTITYDDNGYRVVSLPNLEADMAEIVALAGSAVTDANSRITTFNGSVVSLIQQKTLELLFTDPVITTQVTKESMADYIFLDLGWKKFKELMDLPVTVPPSVS